MKMEIEKIDHVKINVEALATDLKRMLDSNRPLFMPLECCIFPVPTILSRHNPRAYVPNGFSIGPFHYKKQPILNNTQKIKLKYLDRLISRPWKSEQHNENNPDARLRILTKAVTDVQQAAQACYAGWQSFDPTEFVHVLVLDGCFLIELFRRKAYEAKLFDRDDDPIFSMSCLVQFLYHDLILLENQIPWLVLNSLFEITKTAIDEKPLAELVIGFIGNMSSNGPLPWKDTTFLSELNQSKHILDLLRNSWVVQYQVKEKSTTWQPMPSATKLAKVGIKFSSSRSNCPLDIEFDSEKGEMKIPLLQIQETTETLLRNLICLEQCCPNYDPIITSYAVVMDNLINTNTDMEILCKSGAIFNWLNTEDATRLFNKLYDDTYIKENYYYYLTPRVYKYIRESRWPRYRRELGRFFFSSHWVLIYFSGVVFLAICEFLQAFFAVKDKPWACKFLIISTSLLVPCVFLKILLTVFQKKILPFEKSQFSQNI